MNADTLCALYMRTLDAMLIPPVPPNVDKRQTRALLRACRRLGGATLRPPKNRQTWIWADLHAGHDPSLAFFKRPFRTTYHLDYVLFEAWRQLVDADDLMLCLGDVIVDRPEPGVTDRIRKMPGRKHLVAGNHEMFWWGARNTPLTGAPPISETRTGHSTTAGDRAPPAQPESTR